jgi:hypothetical protein
MFALFVWLAGYSGPYASAVNSSRSQCSSSFPAALATASGSIGSGGSVPEPKLAISFMASRYRDLLQVMEGYRLSCEPLVTFDGRTFVPAGLSDDPGLYYLAPGLARAFGITLDRSITLILLVALALGLTIGAAGFMASLESGMGRAISLLALVLLTGAAYRIGDVYIFEFTVAAALLPWTFYFFRGLSRRSLQGKPGATRGLALFLFVAGLMAGACGLIRSSAALPVLLIISMLLLFLFPAQIQRKAVLLAILGLGLAVPRLYFRHLLSRRDAFLIQNVPGYQSGYSRHIWGHFLYSGLAFLSNPYVPGEVSDETAKNKVRSVAPDAAYLSPEYDHVLLREVTSIVRHHPVLALFTFFAKLGVVAGVIAIFANLGLVSAWLYPKPWPVEVAFWLALALAAAPEVLYFPLPQYLLGLMSLATVYGVISLDHALASWKRSRIRFAEAGGTKQIPALVA